MKKIKSILIGLLLSASVAASHAQTVNIIGHVPNFQVINGVSYDEYVLVAAPVVLEHTYEWQVYTPTWFGQPEWTTIGQFTPEEYEAFAGAVEIPSTEAPIFRVIELVEPPRYLPGPIPHHHFKHHRR